MNSDKKLISVFKTSVQHKSEADKIKKQLSDFMVTFDLEDCDKVMRVESYAHNESEIILIMQELGYLCSELN